MTNRNEETVEVHLSHDVDSGELFAYYTKGHVGTDDLLAAIEHGYVLDGEQLPAPASYVRQLYWRNVPHELGVRFVETGGPGRGAYPVTMLDVASYQADRALPRIYVLNHRRLQQHWRSCCGREEPCARGRMMVRTVERQEAALRRAMERLGSEAERAWAELLTRLDGEERRHAALLAALFVQGGAVQPGRTAGRAAR